MPRENSRARPSFTRARPTCSSAASADAAGIRHAEQLAEQLQIFDGREIVIDADAVAQIADGGASSLMPQSQQRDFALRRLRKPGEDAEQRGLPRPVAPDQCDDMSLSATSRLAPRNAG